MKTILLISMMLGVSAFAETIPLMQKGISARTSFLSKVLADKLGAVSLEGDTLALSVATVDGTKLFVAKANKLNVGKEDPCSQSYFASTGEKGHLFGINLLYHPSSAECGQGSSSVVLTDWVFVNGKQTDGGILLMEEPAKDTEAK